MKSIEAAKLFAEEVAAKHKDRVKAVWLVAEEESNSVIILLDDTSVQDAAALGAVKDELMRAVNAIEKKTAVRMEAVFYPLTEYWMLIRRGSPVTFSEIREGIPVYDPSGFFTPIKKLLEQGRIPGTKEAMKALLEEAPMRLLRIERMHMTRIIDELSSAMVDAGQAPLMLIGLAPPVPREVAEKLRIYFVDKGLLEPEYPKYCEEGVLLAKSIEHGVKTHVGGDEIDDLLDKTVRFIARMERLVRDLLKGQK
ncbi:MAG: hypothetical protein QXD77_00010 [Candidatus Aenigmatarchaeota archaeon]